MTSLRQKMIDAMRLRGLSPSDPSQLSQCCEGSGQVLPSYAGSSVRRRVFVFGERTTFIAHHLPPVFKCPMFFISPGVEPGQLEPSPVLHASN